MNSSRSGLSAVQTIYIYIGGIVLTFWCGAAARDPPMELLQYLYCQRDIPV